MKECLGGDSRPRPARAGADIGLHLDLTAGGSIGLYGCVCVGGVCGSDAFGETFVDGLVSMLIIGGQEPDPLGWGQVRPPDVFDDDGDGLLPADLGGGKSAVAVYEHAVDGRSDRVQNPVGDNALDELSVVGVGG